MVNKVHETCVIKVRDAPVELRRRFKALCARKGRSYREMLEVLLDLYETSVKWG